jgi:hypothetical protein
MRHTTDTGQMCVCELTSSSLPQFAQRHVPVETSLPAGTGVAIVGPARPSPLLGLRFHASDVWGPSLTCRSGRAVRRPVSTPGSLAVAGRS